MTRRRASARSIDEQNAGLSVRRLTNPDEIVELLAPHEPRSSIALSEVTAAGPRQRFVDAWVIEDGTRALGVVVVARKAFDLWYSWVLLHDERAARSAALLIDRSNAVALNGAGVDVGPVLVHLHRLDFHRVLPWTVSMHPHDVVEASTDGTRLATASDLEALVELYRSYEYGYEVTIAQLRRTLRDVIGQYPVIVAESDGTIVAALLIVAQTDRFMALDAMTVAPDQRGSGLLWKVATRTQQVANAAGLSILASTAPSNPVTIELLRQQDHWISARLHPRRRFRGQNRLRSMIERRDPRRHREPMIYRDPVDPAALTVAPTRTEADGRIIRT